MKFSVTLWSFSQNRFIEMKVWGESVRHVNNYMVQYCRKINARLHSIDY